MAQVKLRVAGAAFLLFIVCSAAIAQPNDRWVTVGSDATHPIGIGRHFDLAFDVDQRPVLAFLDSLNLNLKKWDGHAWTSLAGLSFSGETPLQVRTAYNWAGDIVVGISTNNAIRVYQLSGSQLNQLGSFPIPQARFAVAIDARGPVVASLDGGFVVVRRWDGANWVQLGQNVNQVPNIFVEEQSPALAVTGDGKLVVGYTLPVGQLSGIAAWVWNGTKWTTLGNGIPPPSRSLSLGGENSGAPVVAYLNGSSPRVSRWNGSTWAAIGRPCAPPLLAINFGAPSLVVPGSLPQVVCGIHTSPDTITGRRMLVGRGWSRLFGWEPLGGSSINGEIALADDSTLAYIVRSGPRGQPWVAWTAQGEGGANQNIIVSTLEPPSNAPQP
jgi:hypothetical protein